MHQYNPQPQSMEHQQIYKVDDGIPSPRTRLRYRSAFSPLYEALQDRGFRSVIAGTETSPPNRGSDYRLHSVFGRRKALCPRIYFVDYACRNQFSIDRIPVSHLKTTKCCTIVFAIARATVLFLTIGIHPERILKA